MQKYLQNFQKTKIIYKDNLKCVNFLQRHLCTNKAFKAFCLRTQAVGIKGPL